MAEEHDEALALFQEITNCREPTFAVSFLEAHGWDLESSVEAFLASAGCVSSAAAGASTSGSEGGERAETEDAVRAPIPVIRDTLLDAGAGFGGGAVSGFNPRTPRTVFDAFRDYRHEEVIRKQKDKHVEAIIKDRPVAEQRKLRTLANIFRPPLEVLFTGSLELAKREGSHQKKWLLVNIQDVQEFASSQLNRDTWSKPELKTVIANSFLMVQTSRDSEEGKRYSVLYKLGEYPHIGILDPRTGQLLRSWAGFVDAVTLLDELRSFVSSHSLDDRSATPLPRHLSGSRPVIDTRAEQKAKVDLTEEEMLAEAIAASLTEAQPVVATETASQTQKKRKERKETTSENEEDEQEGGKAALGKPDKKRPKKEHTLPTEQRDPDKDAAEVVGAECILQIRAMDGSTFSATFREGDTLARVRRWLVTTNRLGGSSSFALVSPFPRRTFGDDELDLPLKRLGLTPRAVLIIHPIPPAS